MEPTFRTIVHVDMDAFFTSVELLDHPELRGKPIVVGLDPRTNGGRGVISAASYEARKYGVRSAQAAGKALQLCPDLIFLPHRYPRYLALSAAAMEILSQFSDRLLRTSIDEAALDCSLTGKPFRTWRNLGAAIKQAVFKGTGLTCSVGIADGPTLAKIASEFHKPDGLTLLLPRNGRDFLAPLPVEAIPGVGPRAKDALNRLGIRRIADLQTAELSAVTEAVGKWAQRLQAIARGIDDEQIVTGQDRRSIGEERTFESNFDNRADAEMALHRIADELAGRMQHAGVSGRTVTLKLRFADFHTITRSQTIPVPVRSSEALFETALRLFRQNVSEAKINQEKIRLLGIQMSNLYTAAPGEQLWLF